MQGASVVDIIDQLCDRIDYVGYLEKSHGPDARERIENLRELQAFAATVATENPEGASADVLPDQDIDMEEVPIVAASTRADGRDESPAGGNDSGFEDSAIL